MTNGLIVHSQNTSLPALKLPDVSEQSSYMLTLLTDALSLPRETLPTDEQITQAWSQLPRLISRIPQNLRDERIVKMCIAVSSGLFDAAINYIWNATIVELRNKISSFGLNIIPQIIDNKSFDEDAFNNLIDAEILDLCLKLNLIEKENYFYLNQCREIRNKYSIAHPADSEIDEDEFVTFLSRCQKHVLSSTVNPKGVDTKKLLESLKGDRFNAVQKNEWVRRIKDTYEKQHELIFVMMHGIYCDPQYGEETRRNAMDICEECSNAFSTKTISALINKHQDYQAGGDDNRVKASRKFFEDVGRLDVLGSAEVHNIFATASKWLINTHLGINNFYNEPPFAQRLASLSKKYAVPYTAQEEYVEAVVTAAVGNPYGISHAAYPFYEEMIKSFSPNEIKIMFDYSKSETIIAQRLKYNNRCKIMFITILKLLDIKSVPVSYQKIYNDWLSQNP